MFLHPGIMGLLLCEALSLTVLIGASVLGLQIAFGWDISSHSSHQIIRESRAALVSVAVGFAMAFQILSLFLFVEAADRLHTMFAGAMCAAGTLNANVFGYPALLVKIAAVFLCGTWLLINHADAQSPHYPFLKTKFYMLPPVAMATVAGGILFFRYAASLDPQIITSCCSVIFDKDGTVLGDTLPRLGSFWAKTVFFGFLAWSLVAGIVFLRTKKGAINFGASSLVMFIVSLIAILSFISPCYYQLPTHHCPFCIMQPQHHRVGYLLYSAIFAGGIFGAGTGALELVATRESTKKFAQKIQERLCLLSMTAFVVVAAMAAWPLVFSDFRMEGY